MLGRANTRIIPVIESGRPILWPGRLQHQMYAQGYQCFLPPTEVLVARQLRCVG